VITDIPDFRIRAAWAEATRAEAARPEMDLAAAEAVISAAEDVTAAVERLWQKCRSRLEETGLSPAESEAAASSALAASSELLEAVRLAAPLLARSAPERAVGAAELTARLTLVRNQARELRDFTRLPASRDFDPERVRRSLEQVERGEGVDVAHILRDLQRL
jgi:hypothetical protein